MTNDKDKEEWFTDEDYQFLLGDIEEAIAEGNRKYGYGEPGYIDADGNFYPFPDNDKPRNFAGLKPRPRPIPKPKRKRRPSVEQVAIARGIIKVRVIQEASYQ